MVAAVFGPVVGLHKIHNISVAVPPVVVALDVELVAVWLAQSHPGEFLADSRSIGSLAVGHAGADINKEKLLLFSIGIIKFKENKCF